MKAKARIRAFTQSLNQNQAKAILEDWSFWARKAQSPPEGDWLCWLFMGGRGAGKTRAGAEWIAGQVRTGAARNIALIGPTLSDVREVMIEGHSGLAHTGSRDERPVYESSRRRLTWNNGAIAHVFSAEDPDSLRGPQFDSAWCDEIAVWHRAEACWDNLMLALRLGQTPRVLATTTPRPVPLVRRLVEMSKTGKAVMTHATMHENRAFLAPGFIETLESAYADTPLARQEIHGELIEHWPGALWSQDLIEQNRIRMAPALDRVLVAIDPPVSSGVRSDACGMIAAGRGADGAAYILADATVGAVKPLDWAGRAVALARERGADAFIAEANQGGEMVREVLRMAGSEIPIRLVHAHKSKTARAEPVAALYAQGRVRHVGSFSALEDQMCAFGAAMSGSPDRVDALVWAVWALLLDTPSNPHVRVL